MSQPVMFDVAISQPVNNPSDIATMAMYFVLVVFFLWVLWKASSKAEKTGDEWGCKFDVVVGFVVLIGLAVLAIVLMSGFQAMYPGH